MKIIVKSKPKSIMKDYVALHWLMKQSDHSDFHHKIPKGEIWIREDIYKDRIKRNLTLMHEMAEIPRMLKGMPYKQAHWWAEMVDGFW